jgi:hypothetical protein
VVLDLDDLEALVSIKDRDAMLARLRAFPEEEYEDDEA